MPDVPHTVTPWSAAAARSMAAFAMPVVTRRRRSGRRSNTDGVNGVRSRMATTISAPATWSASTASSARCSVIDTSSTSALLQSAQLAATF